MHNDITKAEDLIKCHFLKTCMHYYEDNEGVPICIDLNMLHNFLLFFMQTFSD